MPLDVNCPKCAHVFPVTEAKHPFAVQCPGCDVELTAEFRRIPVPTPGQPHYDLLVTLGRPPGTPPAVPGSSSRKLALDDDEEGKRRKGGGMAIVFVVGIGALLVTLGGLGATGYFLFTNLDTDDDYVSTGSSRTGTNRPGTNRPNPGRPNPNPNPSDPFNPVPPQKKVDKFDLRPVNTALGAITPPANLPPEGSSLEIDFGGPAEAVTVAGGGRYIVVHIRSRGLLGVFDATQGKMIGGAEADRGGVQLAGGATRVVAYSGDTNRFRVYSITPTGLTREYDDDKAKIFGWPSAIGLGNRTDGPLLVMNGHGHVVLYNIGPDRLVEVEGSRRDAGGPPGPAVHSGQIRAFPNGTGFATFDDPRNPTSVRVLTESGRDWKSTPMQLTAFPNADGTLLLYGNGVVNTKDGRDAKFVGTPGGGAGTWFVPAVTSSNHFLRIRPEEIRTGTPPRPKPTLTVSVHTNRNAGAPAAGTSVLTDLPEFEHMAAGFGKLGVPADQHFFLIPEAKMLVVIKHDRTKLVMRRIMR